MSENIMIPDHLQRTVKIPIKIVDGKPCLYPKGSLPKLKEGAIDDLVMPAYAMLDHKDAEHYTEIFCYTLISQAFEPDLISHTGNVFSKVYYLADKIWKPLKALRGH